MIKRKFPDESSEPGGTREHHVRCLVATEGCRIDECSCGTLHIRVRNMHFKMAPCEFVHFAAAVGIAGEPYLEQVSHRAN